MGYCDGSNGMTSTPLDKLAQGEGLPTSAASHVYTGSLQSFLPRLSHIPTVGKNEHVAHLLGNSDGLLSLSQQELARLCVSNCWPLPSALKIRGEKKTLNELEIVTFRQNLSILMKFYVIWTTDP